jgi:TolA-binding protein
MKRSALLFSLVLISISASAKAPPPKGALPELQLNKKTEAENLKTAAEAERLISKSEEKAINQLNMLLKKYKGTSQEPDLLFRLAELYSRRAKTGRFVDLYRGEKTLAEILTPKLTAVGAKGYLGQAITNYQTILKKFPQYIAMDEVLFNLAFAHEQRGEQDEALTTFLVILAKHPNSPLLPEAHMALGELYFIKQNYLESQKHYDRVQDWPNAPIAPIALYKSAWCSYNLKNTPEAVSKMEKLLAQSRERPLVSHVRSEARRDLALFYSEVGDPKLAVKYFAKHLLETEIGLTVLDLAAIYERHGKLGEMDLVLNLFIVEYPEDAQAGSILLRRVLHQNEQHKTSLVIASLSEATKLCQKETWKNQNKETLSFCMETYPTQLNDLVVEWWENWNKLKRPQTDTASIDFIFKEYLKFESKDQWKVGVHMSYADFLFSQKDFSASVEHYEGVSKIEKLEAKILHDALYGAIVGIDRMLEKNAKDSTLRQKLLMALNNYIEKCPKGEFVEDAFYKKAFLFYEDKDYVQSLEWLNKLQTKTDTMKEKKEDLILEIHRAKKDYQALADASAAILKVTKGERALKIKTVYQSAQQAIIQQHVEKSDFELAAVKSKAFYEEHRPEEKALEALHLAIELWEKQKKYRLAAEDSEVLAKEMRTLKKLSDAEKLSQHSVQLFLQLGDLARSQKSLQLAIEFAQDETKKRESLELLAEISSWYGQVDATEKAWQALEPKMSAEEKQSLLEKRLKFFEAFSPDRAKKLKEALVQKGVEPFFSQSQIAVADRACHAKKWSECYHWALKLNKDSTPPMIRAQARYLQSRVLLNEYYQQSLKASGDRLAMVMAYKAEKFDKALQVLNTISQKSENLELRKEAVRDLITLYTDYVTQLQKSLAGLDTNQPEMASLQQEIEQILPVLSQRPKELELALGELNKFSDQIEVERSLSLATPFPELNGSELRVYVPTWEESSPRRPLSEIKISSQSCNEKTLETLNTLSALGREANSCLQKKQYRELELASLRLSDLFPDSPWGPFYLSVAASQQHFPDRALWYLKLGQKRMKDTLLSYEEARQTYLQRPDSNVIAELKKVDATWALIEEATFVSALALLKQNQCEAAVAHWKDLRTNYWKSVPLDKTIQRLCPNVPMNTRAVSSTEPAN